MQNDILSLQETSENTWKAKYLGNCGTYNIKIKINKGKIETYSCSCPSDYSPCKHMINMPKEILGGTITNTLPDYLRRYAV